MSIGSANEKLQAASGELVAADRSLGIAQDSFTSGRTFAETALTHLRIARGLLLTLQDSYEDGKLRLSEASLAGDRAAEQLQAAELGTTDGPKVRTILTTSDTLQDTTHTLLTAATEDPDAPANTVFLLNDTIRYAETLASLFVKLLSAGHIPAAVSATNSCHEAIDSYQGTDKA